MRDEALHAGPSRKARCPRLSGAPRRLLRLCRLFAFGRVPPLSLLPAAVVAVLLALGAVKRSPFLQLVGVFLGVVCAVAFVVASLAKSF